MGFKQTRSGLWTADDHNEIGALVLAGRSRQPVLAGEAKWAKTVSAQKIVASLIRKIDTLPGKPHDIQFAVCARETVTHQKEGVRVITAADIFQP